MTAPLFSPFELGPVRLTNRIVISPMCQYSANDGCMNDWHLGDDPWITYAPSPLPFDDGWPTPEELTDPDLARIEKAFVQAAERAVRIGFEAIELHMAHGYLLHTFQSPLSNKRADRWGGSPEKRLAFPLSVARAVRAAVPEHVALGARITGSDWTDDGVQPEGAVALSKVLKEIGLDFVCVSSGGDRVESAHPGRPRLPGALRGEGEARGRNRHARRRHDPRSAPGERYRHPRRRRPRRACPRRPRRPALGLARGRALRRRDAAPAAIRPRRRRAVARRGARPPARTTSSGGALKPPLPDSVRG
jgi:2,4-dienoyl-CoA reductase-like NADH-dependent reductase (Old Yellow Enzyme family)